MKSNYIRVNPPLNKLNRYNSIIIGVNAFDIYKTEKFVYLTNIGEPTKIVAKYTSNFFEYLEYCNNLTSHVSDEVN